MKVHIIRRNISSQCFSTHEDSNTTEVESFFWYQVSTGGWTSGSRNRMKTFGSLDSVYAYLNKLNAGAWLSDEDYHNAWRMALKLEQTTSDAERLLQTLAIRYPRREVL